MIAICNFASFILFTSFSIEKHSFRHGKRKPDDKYLISIVIYCYQHTFTSSTLIIMRTFYCSLLHKTNEKTRYWKGRAIFKSINMLFSNYKSKYQRNNDEIPKSTNTKNKAIITTVEITTTVYFVSSLLFGQLVFRISDITSLKKLLILPILA